MCRNHSHIAGFLVAQMIEDDVTEYSIVVEKPLTVELSTGARLALPPFSLCLVRLAHPGAYADLLRHVMAEQAGAGLSRDETERTSGPTTPTK